MGGWVGTPHAPCPMVPQGMCPPATRLSAVHARVGSRPAPCLMLDSVLQLQGPSCQAMQPSQLFCTPSDPCWLLPCPYTASCTALACSDRHSHWPSSPCSAALVRPLLPRQRPSRHSSPDGGASSSRLCVGLLTRSHWSGGWVPPGRLPAPARATALVRASHGRGTASVALPLLTPVLWRPLLGS